ncbi:heterokaryon incompatibility protein-domain-containing protein [Colletotrichum phormii]|uniref:Heterokaryon incompatibility protein-domain-containing protein n=1 Tax=Colletotrichum phormii TaxID=359342 RepID=A0AAJ0EEJ2_9PEZI|nr:heterokaryon incompatibility protein-domain-containing protein [Colletotrichum phormii]KAK1635903.1 heterokaryon incompatibility protein-domain-containing protein [Colletotrichum phormii]
MMSWLFQGQRRADSFSTIEDFGDLDGQKKCRGCKQIRALLDFYRRHNTLPPKAVVFHENYASLDRCAQFCVTCRIFRQALLLEGVSADHVAVMEDSPGHVCAKLVTENDQLAVRIHINEDVDARIPAAMVFCAPSKDPKPPTRLKEDSADDAIFKQIKEWLRKCEQCHIDCGNLAYSDRVPTRLLHIISDSEAQLVGSNRLIADGKAPRYAALSYCWGTGNFTVDENEMVERGQTLRANLESRCQPFDIESLPGTIRDAIKITRRLSDPENGLELCFLWIDSLCIIQDDVQDKEVEIQRMQEVYGNAVVTICATTTAKATQSLLMPRLAWSKLIKSCRIGTSWLTVSPTLPAGLRARAPLSLRAWTLQEEHLSPRVLFWGGQQFSWACGRGEYVEDISSSTLSRPSVTPFRKFLAECRTAEPKELWLAWNSIVESYTARSLSNPADRFNALAGLATRYLAAVSGYNQYMAGLWRATFAQDLLWRVARPSRPDEEWPGTVDAPSWSWASLPISLGVRMWDEFEMPTEVELVGDVASVNIEPSEAVAQGAGLSHIRVRGLLRTLWSPKSQLREWSDVCVQVNGVNKFRFGSNPGQDVHAVDSLTGNLVAYEARKQEIVAELDSCKLAEDITEELLSEIYCLAISEHGMLLLRRKNIMGAFQRVGIGFGYRRDFFKSLERTEVVLE